MPSYSFGTVTFFFKRPWKMLNSHAWEKWYLLPLPPCEKKLGCGPADSKNLILSVLLFNPLAMVTLLPVRWSRANAFVFETRGLRFKSRSVKSDTVFPTARNRCGILWKEVMRCISSWNGEGRPQLTRFMLRRNAANIIKVCLDFFSII